LAILGCNHCGYTRTDAGLGPRTLPARCPECSRTLRLMTVQEGRLLAAQRVEADVYRRQAEAFRQFKKAVAAKR
jgi:hypothetical protein